MADIIEFHSECSVFEILLRGHPILDILEEDNPALYISYKGKPWPNFVVEVIYEEIVIRRWEIRDTSVVHCYFESFACMVLDVWEAYFNRLFWE